MSGVNGTTGFFTPGEFGNSALEARGNEALPSTFGEAMGSQFSQAFADNVTTRLVRRVARNFDSNVLEMPVEELNREFGVPGRLTFDTPMTERQARDLYEHHRANALRDDAIRRRGDNVGGGTGASILSGLLVGIIDPLNIASAFIPVAGQANIARVIGTSAARGALGRATVRGIEGALGGLVGGLAVEPLNAFLTIGDKDDYTMTQFMANIAIGTVIGGALNSGVGALRDRRGLPPWSPEMHDAGRTQAIAALAEGRPVQAAQAMDFIASRDGGAELRRWYDGQVKQAADVDNALDNARTREAAVDAARTRLDELQMEARKVRLELDEANGRLSAYGIEPSTRERLDDIETELATTIPKKRRADLERERTMLLEGRDWAAEARAGGDLEAGRTEAEIAGIGAVADRLAQKEAMAALNLTAAQRRLQAAETTLEQRQATFAARRDMVRDLAMRTLRGVAYKTGVQIEQRELWAAAMRIMRAAPDDVDATIRAELKTITDRAVGPFLPDQVVMRPPARSAQLEATMGALERNLSRSTDDLTNGVRGAADDVSPETRVNDADIARAPKFEGTVDEAIADLDASTADLERALKAEDDAVAARAKREGREPPPRDPEMDEANAIREEGASMSRAYEAAAVCQIERR